MLRFQEANLDRVVDKFASKGWITHTLHQSEHVELGRQIIKDLADTPSNPDDPPRFHKIFYAAMAEAKKGNVAIIFGDEPSIALFKKRFEEELTRLHQPEEMCPVL